MCVCVILCHISYGLIFEPACFTIFYGLFLWRNLMKSSGFSACEAPRAPRLKIEAVRKFLDLAAQVPCASTGFLKYPPEKNKVDPGIGVGRLVKPLKHGDSQDELLIYQMVNHLLSYCGWLRNPAPWMVETLQRDKPPINWCSISRPPTVGSWHLLI